MERNCDNCARNEYGDMKCVHCLNGDFVDQITGKIYAGQPTEWIPKGEAEIEPVDRVNKPNHYQLSDGKDCFDVMIEMFGVEAVQTYCVLNAFTYLFRHARKNGVEDVLKAEYNLAKFKQLEERKNG